MTLTAAEATSAGLDPQQLPLALQKSASSDEPRYEATVWDVWVEIDLRNGWRAAYRLHPSRPKRAAAIGEIRVFQAEPLGKRVRAGTWNAEKFGTLATCPRGGINARVLKSIRLKQVVPQINSALQMIPQLRGIPMVDESARAYAPFAAPEVLTPKAKHGTGRRPTTPDAEYAKVAAAYRNALDNLRPKAAEEVARNMGIRSAAHVRMMVHRGAKQRGLIVSGGGGVWHLTPQALALLKPSKQKKGPGHGKKTRKR